MASHSGELHITATAEDWPLARAFVISRGAKTHARVVVAHITDGEHQGRGEAVPYARYGESVEEALEQIRACTASDRLALQEAMPAGAARNALDCAFWDLDAKRQGRPASSLAGIDECKEAETAYTISLGTPDAMAEQARSAGLLRLLKLKLGAHNDAERMRAVRSARPDARLIVDANEGWTAADLPALIEVAAECGVELIEQPLPADADGVLSTLERKVPVCADESALTSADIERLIGRYDAVNIKLDKAGGLTEALAMRAAARRHGLNVMIGSMVATSLAVAPALLLAQEAEWVDLDGPLLLAHDRAEGLTIRDGFISPASPDLWG